MQLKFYILLIFSFFTLTTYGQINNDYLAVIDGDTLTILLTEAELITSKESREAELRHLTKHKKKRLQEKISCEIKLRDNDTTYWAGIVDYYDNYLIALIGTLEQKSKNESTITPLRFRRINFNEIERMKTDGKKNIVPQLLLASVFLCIGPSLTILSIKDDFKGEEDPFPPALIPVGLGITYLGVRLFSPPLRTHFEISYKISIEEQIE